MATERLQIYKCSICGNVVQVLLNGNGELVCCGQAMSLQIPQHDKSEVGEKHAPVMEFRDNRKVIQVKSHPMIEEHYIQFIEVIKNDNTEFHLKYLSPNQAPEFDISYISDEIKAIEFCNIHGLWGENKND